jgi:hypothetical protein
VIFGKTDAATVQLSNVHTGSGGFVIRGGASQNAGSSVSSAGDVNGDGLADLIVGTYRESKYVVFGKTSGSLVNISNLAQSAQGFMISLAFGNGIRAEGVSNAGDVNGDGLADLIVDDGNNSVSYVVFGKTNTATVSYDNLALGQGGFVINAESRDAYRVSSAGDVNGDGLADVIVGVPSFGNFEGRSYVLYGKTSGAAINLSAVAAGSTAGFVIKGASVNDWSGNSVSAAGDVNGDGLADVIVGAMTVNRGLGRSYVVFGATNGQAVELSAVATGLGGFLINGEPDGRETGFSVSSAGDVNGDGLADLIVGAPATHTPTGEYAGRSYVVYGQTGGAGIELSSVANGIGGFAINGYCSSDYAGTSVSSAGDVNGDGLADLFVSARETSPTSSTSKAGTSYVIFGNTAGAFNQSAVDWIGTAGNDTQSDGGLAKTLVSGAGDDVLTATAASVLYGGVGKDTFNIDAAMITALQSAMGSGGNTTQLARIDGGGGLDTIVLSGSGLTLDLTQIANQAASNPDGGSRIDSVEIINLTGTGDNALKLKATDVLDMGSANLFQTTGRQQLLVKGNAGDTVDLADGTGTTGWTQATANATIDSTPYQVWNHTSLATVYVQTGVLVG